MRYYLLNILNLLLICCFLNNKSKEQKNYNCRKNFKYKSYLIISIHVKLLKKIYN